MPTSRQTPPADRRPSTTAQTFPLPGRGRYFKSQPHNLDSQNTKCPPGRPRTSNFPGNPARRTTLTKLPSSDPVDIGCASLVFRVALMTAVAYAIAKALMQLTR